MKHVERKQNPDLSGSSFKHYLQQHDITPGVIQRHQQEVARYKQWLQQAGKTIEQATKKDLLAYLQHCKQSRNLQNVTLERILQKLKHYHHYLARYYDLPNITAFVKIQGTHRQYIHQVLTPDELDLLCEAYYHHTRQYQPSRKELRYYPDYDRLLQGRYIALTLMAYQGLQVQEVLALAPDDVDTRKATVTLHPHRRGAGRTLPLEALQIGIIMQYFNVEQTTLIPNRNHLENLNKTLKTLHPQYQDFRQLRASRITHWIKLHGLRRAQHLAGHTHIQSTEKYLPGDIQSLKNDLDNFHPLK